MFTTHNEELQWSTWSSKPSILVLQFVALFQMSFDAALAAASNNVVCSRNFCNG